MDDLGQRVAERAGREVGAGQAETHAVAGERRDGAPGPERGAAHRVDVAPGERDRIGGVEGGFGDAEQIAECRVVRAVSHHAASSPLRPILAPNVCPARRPCYATMTFGRSKPCASHRA